MADIVDEGPPLNQLVPASQEQQAPIEGDEGPALSQLVSPNEYYSSTGQQVGSVVEGAGRGLLGPIFTAGERAVGIPGSDIQGRQEANPIKAGVGEASTFLGSLLVPGLQENSLAGVVGKIGEGAKALTGIGEAGNVARIAGAGIKTGAELAALKTGDELSRTFEGDPGQTVGSAAINIGLSGVLGGVGGAALGTVSPLWGKAKNILSVDKLANDFMGETKAIQEAGDPLTSATNELKGRMDAAESMRESLGTSKPEIIAKALPEATPENVAKIDEQIQNIDNRVSGALDDAAKSVKTRNAVPYLSEDLINWQSAVTDPSATIADKYTATDKLKRTLQSYAKWAGTEEATAKGALGAELSSYLKPALEDTKVWGGAGDVQRVTNEATANLIRATKDLRGSVTSKLLGETELAPEKIQSFLNQANAGKVGRKATVLENYLEATQKQADAIKSVHLENGLEPPLASTLDSTPVLNHALNTEVTPGVKLARYLHAKGASLLGQSAGEAVAGAGGAALGSLVGHPLLGAWAGERLLGPIFSTLAKPFAENAVNSAAARSAVDYLGNAARGQQLLEKGVSNIFNSGAEVLGKDLIPDQESRDKLEKSITAFSANPESVGGQIGHYLPNHATAVGATAAQSVSYLNSLKPIQPKNAPLDMVPPVNKSAQYKYNRALDIAQQPLLVLQHAKNGTLLPDDVQAIRQIYPNIHQKMVSSITNEFINKNLDVSKIPYAQRVSLNMLMGGNALDSTLTPFSMQQAIQANSSGHQPQPQMQGQKQARNNGGTEKALKQIDKVNALYATKDQAQQIERRQS